MKKRIPALLAALCLMLSGCGNVVLERSFSVSAPHSEAYWENEGADTLRADGYQDLVNALLLLLGEHSEEGTVRIYGGDDPAAMAERACREVQEELEPEAAEPWQVNFYPDTDDVGIVEVVLGAEPEAPAET